MKCINKKKLYSITGILLSIMLPCGCGQKVVVENAYDVYETTKLYGLNITPSDDNSTATGDFFAKDLCVAGSEDLLSANVTDSLSEAAGLFDVSGKTVKFGKNIHEKLYPASTTKILTSYVALKHGDLSAKATVTAEELQLEEGSSTCGLSVGDTISLEQLLYGLMLCSGNDAANVIADLVSGSTEDFAKLMNEEANALGATNSHFINPHGLHDENHYTTVYDMYLIFQAAIKDEQFLKVIGASSYTAEYTNAGGETITREWKNTNKYISGEETTPEGIQVVGGKTGTTNAAGNCLVLLSSKNDGNSYISIVYKADSRENLYVEMTELLKEILK